MSYRNEEPEINLRAFLDKLPFKFGRMSGGNSFSYIVLAIVSIVLVIWLANGFYSVQPGEVAVIKLFGKLYSEEGPGLHWFPRAPIGEKNIVFVEEIKRLELGFRGTQSFPEESVMITGDENIVDVQLLVQYDIKNATDYLFETVDPSGSLIKDATETALRQVVGSSSIDTVIIEREIIQTNTKLKLQQLLDDYQSGIRVKEVKLQGVNPPDEVKPAFADVVIAKEDKETIINQAQAYEESILPQARGESRKLIEDARAFKATRVNIAEGQASKFTSILIEYEKAPNITRQRLLYETMEEVLPDITKFIIDTESGILPILPLGQENNISLIPESSVGKE
jgi:membrane protease subunit HflK